MGVLSWYVSILYPVDLSETTEAIILSLTVFVILCLVKLYVEGPSWKPVDLNGKVVIVTGSNTGIGKVTAKELTRAGAEVILACRNATKAAAAIQSIKKDIAINGMYFDPSREPNLYAMKLDLSSFASVREFVDQFNDGEGHNRLDILINNAGCMTALRKTDDGCDLQMQANHLSHFLLTNLLLENLQQSEQGRIVNVSSVVHQFASWDSQDPYMDEEEEKGGKIEWLMYARTKLCNILFTRHLNRMLQQVEGNKITVNSLHPGNINSDFTREFPYFVQVAAKTIGSIFLKSVNSGAQNNLHVATAPQLANVSGEYFDGLEQKDSSMLSQNPKVAESCWEWSEQVVGLNEKKEQ